MYLKSLTIKGFKSFAAKSELAFEPGTTVIVGPNGSGKSNIVDAFLWVTGEQSARSLRSTKMQDVIFAGSAQKSPMGVSDVTLAFDNSSRVFPVDYNEVTFTRRLFRSGESEYLMNGNVCRLTDINDLLVHTNMGRDMYSIVGQGRLDSVLNSRPEDRRVLIEEAAGLAKYKRRKEKALRKLAATERNLIRVQDIVAEIRRQLKPLESQAKTAREHRRLVDELRTAEVEYIVLELRELEAKREQLKKETEKVEKLLGNSTKTAEKGREKLRALEQSLGNAMETLEVLKERKYGLATNAERLRGRIGLLREKEANLRLVGERFVGEAQGLADELKALAEDKKALEKAILEKEKSLRAFETKEKPRIDPSAAAAALADINNKRAVTAAKIEGEKAFLKTVKRTAQQRAGFKWPAGTVGYLWDLIEVKPGFEAVAEALFGGGTSAVISRNAVSAAKLLKDGRHQSPALIASLISEAAAISVLPKGLTPASEFISAKGLDKKLFQEIVDGAYLADSMETVLKYAEKPDFKGARFVTKKGESLAGALAMPTDRHAEEILARQNILADLEKVALGLVKESEALVRGLAKAEKKSGEYAARTAPLIADLAEDRIKLQVLGERENLLIERTKSAGVGKTSVGDAGEFDSKTLKRQAEKIGGIRLLSERLLAAIGRYLEITEQEILVKRNTETGARQDIAKVRAQLTEVEKQIAVTERDAHLEEISEAQLEPKIAALIEQLSAEFGMTPADAGKTHPSPGKRDDLADKMRQIRTRIEYMGPINPIAAEEFDEVRERQEHLETQTRDLKRSERSLHKVISLMDKQMGNKFLDIFKRVDESFQDVFKNMFPDGKAQLLLTNPDDLLTTGIEIEAQPSGRRLKKVSLLSGGESAMTALALVFGLFQINPAPFYILDEADVALDDINLQRFVALIKKFKTQAQFLIVTHQRRTMEVADILYGVSMQKDGVSKVVSQKLEEA